jgi:hypothetical protein
MAGRRINLAVPEESLLITKSVGTVPHTGGKLIKKDSPFYKTLVEWIRAGAEYDKDGIPSPPASRSSPPTRLTGSDVRVPFTVRATYSDGTDRDVTTLSPSPPPTTTRSPSTPRTGLATSKNRGEAFMLARFHTFTEGSQAIVVPADLAYERPGSSPSSTTSTPTSTKNSTSCASSLRSLRTTRSSSAASSSTSSACPPTSPSGRNS